jgi:hypothetical protein
MRCPPLLEAGTCALALHTFPTLTASCHAYGGGAPSHSKQDLPIPLGGARAGVNADYNAENNIPSEPSKGEPAPSCSAPGGSFGGHANRPTI